MLLPLKPKTKQIKKTPKPSSLYPDSLYPKIFQYPIIHCTKTVKFD